MISDIYELSRHIAGFKRDGLIVGVISGGFDILHRNHIKYIKDAKNFCHFLVAIVNSDEFLIRKKGYRVVPLLDRMVNVDSIKGVDATISWDDGSQFVDGALKILKPTVFLKGGDRNEYTMADCEKKACEEIGCKIVYGVGGNDKSSSSSWLINDMIKSLPDEVLKRMRSGVSYPI